MKSEARDLGGVDDALLDHVAELFGVRVEAEVIVLAFANASDDDGTISGFMLAWRLKPRYGETV